MVLTFNMPADRHKLSSLFRRRNLISSVIPTVPMRVCKNCDKANRPKKCKVGGSSDYYVECARVSYSCNLAPFSPTRWARIEKKRQEKAKEFKETFVKLNRLQVEVKALEKQKLKIVEGELRNIEEVKADE